MKGELDQQPVRQIWGSAEGSSPLFSLELAVLLLAPPLPPHPVEQAGNHGLGQGGF